MTRSYHVGSPAQMDRGTAYWAHRYALNVAYPRWNEAYPMLQQAIASWEEQGEIMTLELDQRYANGTITKDELYAACNTFADKMVAAWKEVPDMLMTHFVDGYTNYNTTVFGVENPNFYPSSWLLMMNYTSGPGYGEE